MIEFAVTAGEGTLLAYGVAEQADVDEDEIRIFHSWKHFDNWYTREGVTLIARPCKPDCETGQ